MTALKSHREIDDRYYGELVRHGRLRVIVCRDGLQWIVQRQKGGTGGRWVALGYFLTREALVRFWTGLECPACLELTRLPRSFGGSAHD